MRKLFYLTIILISFLSLNAVETNFDKMLGAAKKLEVNPSDNEAFTTVRDNLSPFSEPSVKVALIKVLSFAKLSADKNSFETFKSEMATKEPSLDFSFAMVDEAKYKENLKKSVTHLVLSASQAQDNLTGLALAKINLKPNTARANPYFAKKASSVEVVAINNKVEEKKEEVIEKVDFESKVEEAQKTKLGDIAKDSIFFKVHAAAVLAQKGDVNGIKELIQLSYVENKPDELTSNMVKAMTLGMLDSNSKSIDPFIFKINSIFPDNAFLNFLDQQPFSVTCKVCAGKGHKEQPCKACSNGVCRNCKGQGTISYRGLGGENITKDCPTCKGQKTCNVCNGEKIEKKNCISCANRGTITDRSVFKEEYAKALQYLIDITPKLAEEANVYIGVGTNAKAIARIDELRKQQREYEEKLKAIARAERAKELAKLEEERKKKSEELAASGENSVSETEGVTGTSMSNLQYCKMEFENYLKAQERRTKSSFYKSLDAKFVGGKVVLYVDVNDSFTSSTKDYKLQILDAYYRFWKLRAGMNSLGSNVDVVLTNNGKEVALSKNGEFIIK